MSNEVCLYLYVSDFYKLFIYFWTMSTFFRVMGLPLSWSVVNHSSTNNDSDMNMKNILSFQRKMDMKLAFYIFLWVFFSSSSCILWEYVWQTPFLLHNFNPFFMKEILPFWLFGLILPFFQVSDGGCWRRWRDGETPVEMLRLLRSEQCLWWRCRPRDWDYMVTREKYRVRIEWRNFIISVREYQRPAS